MLAPEPVYSAEVSVVLFETLLILWRRRDVALNGPLLAQIGRDGNTYAGRARSGMLEGCEMIFTGDKRLHSRGHKKPPVGLNNGQGVGSSK